MMHGHDEWFADQGGLPLVVPVKIGTPGPGFTLVSSDTPVFLTCSEQHVITIEIRNDGPTALDNPDIRFAYHTVGLEGSTADGLTKITHYPGKIETGRIGKLSVPIAVMPSSWYVTQAASGLQWALTDAKGSIGTDTNRIDFEPALFVGGGWNAKTSATDVPQEMRAGKKTSVTVTLTNIGSASLTKAEDSVICRWYDSDGKEVQGVESISALPSDIKADGHADINLSIPAPAYDGRYTLVIGVTSGKELFAGPTTHGGDTLLTQVRIVKGKRK
jgi:hypothetical protein